MAITGEGFRPPLNQNHSSTSFATLEVAVPSRDASSSIEIMSYYMNKALPPPPVATPKGHVKRYDYSRLKDTSALRPASAMEISDVAQHKQAPTQKIENLMGHIPNIEDQSPEISQIKEPAFDRGSLSLSKSRQRHTSKYTHGERSMKSDSTYSYSSASVYSQDGVVEDFVDSYSEWGSWAPSTSSAHASTKPSLYLQTGTYSVTESETEPARYTDVSHKKALSKIQMHRPTLSLTGPPTSNRIESTQRAVTLDSLVTEEREHLARQLLLRDGLLSNQGEKISTNHDYGDSESVDATQPSWNTYAQLVGSLMPEPLSLRLRNFPEPARSESRFSDHSSLGEPGVISSARNSIYDVRNSVISHIRSIPSAFKLPSRPSLVFKEKAASSIIRVPSPSRSIKRKRRLSSGRHPLKSPFPFLSPNHKEARLDEVTDPISPSFARRFSDAIRHRSSSRTSPVVESSIISNYARTGEGPDTPIPTKPNFMGVISPAAAFHKAKRAAKIRSRDERRRDKLRKAIVVIGTADQSPDGLVTTWL